jgi:hypothetical protein
MFPEVSISSSSAICCISSGSVKYAPAPVLVSSSLGKILAPGASNVLFIDRHHCNYCYCQHIL